MNCRYLSVGFKDGGWDSSSSISSIYREDFVDHVHIRKIVNMPDMQKIKAVPHSKSFLYI